MGRASRPLRGDLDLLARLAKRDGHGLERHPSAGTRILLHQTELAGPVPVTREAPTPGTVRVLGPDHQGVHDPPVELAKKAAHADEEARRAARLADRRRRLGVDPDDL